MREILFRGKRIDNGEWIEGQFLKREGCYIAPVVNSYMVMGGRGKSRRLQFGDFYEVIPETIGQYTGQKDKNDEKIFDKHIVKICGGNNLYGEITYSNDTASYWIENKSLEYYIQLGDIKPSCIEVIGNVIGNPELLEVK